MTDLPIRSKIHRTDPYANFFSEQPADPQGWGSDHPAFEVLIKKIRPKLIIEVGSWKGASANHMARICTRLDLKPEIVYVDTWLGSPGLYTRPNDEFYDSLQHVNGYPSIYYTFLTNVVAAGHKDLITPMPLPSQLAAETLTAFGASADLIYIDAAHDYRSVQADLESFWPLLAPNGVLFGDDYLHWPGVTKAANEFAGRVGRPIYAAAGKFVIPKAAGFSLNISFG